MAVEFELAYGDLDIEGVRGMTAKMANGGVKAVLDGGPAHVDLNVGDIQFATRERNYREIRAISRVGKVELSVNGYRIRGENKPGSGDEASASGSGDEYVFLRTGVGRVRAAIGVDSLPSGR